MVELLLAAGALVDSRNNMGQTALAVAAQFGQPRAAALLIAGGAALESADDEERTPLLTAAAYGQAEVMKLLLQAGANMNARDEDGYYALHRIAHGPGKNPECAELLLERGMPVDIRTEYGGRTALMATTYFEEREAIAGKLLEAGARIDACDILGQTALMYAAKRGNLELVRLLLAAGADASLKDVFGKDALVHAGSEKIREAISASRAVSPPQASARK